ncbi:hypothetical protein D3C80_1873060 [compost metagenome]
MISYHTHRVDRALKLSPHHNHLITVDRSTISMNDIIPCIDNFIDAGSRERNLNPYLRKSSGNLIGVMP